MSEEEINNKGFDLISKLSINKKPKINNQEKPNEKRLLGEKEPFHLGEVGNLEIIQNDYFNKKIVTKFTTIEKNNVGFNEEGYNFLRELSQSILEEFNDVLNVNNEFIEKNIFNWVIDVHKKQRAEYTLVSYLFIKKEDECQNFEFYYKIKALQIENSITIGNTKLTELEESFFEIQTLEKTSAQIKIRDEYNQFLKTVLAQITVNNIYHMAEQHSRDEVKLAINALKCVLIKESVEPLYQLPELDFISQKNVFSNYISLIKGKSNTLKYHSRRNSGTYPTIINSTKLGELFELGLGNISEFLKIPPNSELSFSIRASINNFGETIATRDLHEKIVRLISFFESTIIPKNNNKAKGLSILKKNVFPKLFPDHEIASKTFIRIYKIRDRFVHNNERLPISIEDHLISLHSGRIFLLRLIKISKSKSTNEDILKHFEIK